MARLGERICVSDVVARAWNHGARPGPPGWPLAGYTNDPTMRNHGCSDAPSG